MKQPVRYPSRLLICSVLAFFCGSFAALVAARPTTTYAATRVEYRFVESDDSQGRKRELERLAESGWIAKSITYDTNTKGRVIVLMEKIYER